MEYRPPSSTAAAHAIQAGDNLRLHSLEHHLVEVAQRAARNASAFKGASWAHLAGLWHDLGKYRPGFQRYLHATSSAEAENAHIESGAGRVSHSTVGE